MTLRDALTLWGEKHNIELTQMNNRTVDGKTLYLFGNVQFYIDDDVPFARVGENPVKWEPMSMQELLERNHQMEEDPMDLSVCYKQAIVPVHILTPNT